MVRERNDDENGNGAGENGVMSMVRGLLNGEVAQTAEDCIRDVSREMLHSIRSRVTKVQHFCSQCHPGAA